MDWSLFDRDLRHESFKIIMNFMLDPSEARLFEGSFFVGGVSSNSLHISRKTNSV